MKTLACIALLGLAACGDPCDIVPKAHACWNYGSPEGETGVIINGQCVPDPAPQCRPSHQTVESMR